MSEKRFYLDEEDRLCIHYDDRIVACVGCRETEAEKIVDLLNEQQATIKQQDIEIKNLNLHIRKLVGESEISQQLMKEYERNDKLEAKIESMVEQHKARLDKLIEKIGEQQATIEELKEENSNLNSILNEVGLQKPFIKILDDYMVEYDGSCFSMHKPSDIRSFVYLMNRNNNFDELQCEYNDESMVIDDE